jgi:galactonate dehydratase
MHIADIRWYPVHAGWRNWVFVEVETDTGLIGLGEATLEGRELTIQGHLQDLRRVLIGADATSISGVRQLLTRDPFWIGGYVAGTGLAAVEIALWDIMGKELGQPVWRLLGGRVHGKLPVYANGWYFGVRTVDEWVQRATEVVELGYRALKFDPFGRAGLAPTIDEIDLAMDIVGSLRRALGPKVSLLIEGHGRFSVHAALTVAQRLEEYGCFFFEEPVPPGNADAMRHVTEHSRVPIAGGERCYSRLDARRLLELGAVHILQPDVLHVGGIAEAREIASMAESWFVQIAPHNPNGAVATAATLAVDVVSPNFQIQEMLEPWDVSWRHEVVLGAPRVIDGHIDVTEAPGLGVELDHAAIADHPFEPIDPALFSEDSIMEVVDLRPGVSGEGSDG